MPLYKKPNGKEIEINDNSVEYAESIGWKLVKPKAKTKAKTKKATK